MHIRVMRPRTFAFRSNSVSLQFIILILFSFVTPAVVAQASAPSEIAIQVEAGTVNSGRVTLQALLSDSVNTGTLHAMLNGRDITAQFSSSICTEGSCLKFTVNAGDGLREGKNVIYVTAHTNDGKLATGRLRFYQGNGGSSTTVKARLLQQSRGLTPYALRANDTSGSATDSTFLPPMLTFQTIYSGGWTGKTPWFQVGLTGQYPAVGEAPCSTGNPYLTLVFDRQTLDQIGSKGCYSSEKTSPLT